MHQPGLYKISLYSRGKDATMKDFILEILICFNLPITEQWTSYTKHSISSPPYFTEWSNFCAIGWLQMFLSFKSKGTMCEDSTSFEFLNVWSLAYAALRLNNLVVVRWFLKRNFFAIWWIWEEKLGKLCIFNVTCVFLPLS